MNSLGQDNNFLCLTSDFFLLQTEEGMRQKHKNEKTKQKHSKCHINALMLFDAILCTENLHVKYMVAQRGSVLPF